MFEDYPVKPAVPRRELRWADADSWTLGTCGGAAGTLALDCLYINTPQWPWMVTLGFLDPLGPNIM